MKVKTQVSGFTLVEFMLIVAVLAILATLATPGFSSLLVNNRIDTARDDFIHDLLLARSESVRRDVRISMCKSSNAGDASPSCVTSGGWDQGWIVFADTSTSNGERDTNEEVIAVHLNADVNITGETNVSNYISFLPSGRSMTISGTPQPGSITFSSNGFSKTILLSNTGRPTAQ